MASKTLPREIIVEILARLRVKDILRFRCVSKPWCSLIDGPDFIKLHLSRSLETNNNTGVVSFNRPSLGWTDLGDLENLVVDLGDLENSVVDLAKIPMTVSPDHQIVNACNGVVMLADLLGHGGDVFLFNPATRRSWKVPLSHGGDRPKDLSLFMSESHVIGFGYDHETDDYKLLRQSFGEINGVSPPSRRVEVYSLKSKTWKRVKGFKHHHGYNHCMSALVHNTLHWVVKPHSYFAPSVIIASYDVAAETYAEVALPPYSGDPFYVTVAELHGKLCVLCHYGGSVPGQPPPPRVMTVYEVAMNRMVADRVDVWAMEEYGDVASWGELFSVSRSAETGDFVSFTPLVFLSEEAVLLNVEGGVDRFLVYNLAMKKMVSEVTISGISRGVSAFGCVGSLVGIRGGYEEVSYGDVNKKKKIKKTEQVRPSEKNKKKNKRDGFLSKGFKLVL